MPIVRKLLGKRQPPDNGSLFRTKKLRTDQQVPSLEDGPSSGGSAGGASDANGLPENMVPESPQCRRVGNVDVPPYGTAVERTRARRAGPYVLGHWVRTSSGVPQEQYLARNVTNNEYFLLKMFAFDPLLDVENKEQMQGRLLLHAEYSLLSLLGDVDGVIHQHGFFMDYALEEKQVESADGTKQVIYTGQVNKRLILVLDCVHPHGFSDHSSVYINMQRYVFRHKCTEAEAIQIFYEIVKVVEQLHKRNIIHRDLKLNNIVLNRRTKKITLTNFFLGKHLMNEDESLYDQRGSPAYISPDVLVGKPYKGKPTDIWALGVILYIMVYGKFPFLETTPTALFRKIREVSYVIPADTKVSETTSQLIKSILTPNPDERLNATEIRQWVEKLMRTLRGPKIQVDQIVPELAEPSDDCAASTSQAVPTLSGAKLPPLSDYTPTYPKHDLSTEPFSRILESLKHKRENESFLKPNLNVSIQAATGGLVGRVPPHQPPAGSSVIRSLNLGPTADTGMSDSPVESGTVSEDPSTNEPGTGNTTEVASGNRRCSYTLRFAPQICSHVYGVNASGSFPPPPLLPLNGGRPLQPSAVAFLDHRSFNRIVSIASVRAAAAISSGSITFQNPAVQSLYSAMNDLFVRGRIPPPNLQSLDFRGIITPDMANKIVSWLVVHLRNHELIREIFGGTAGNRVNNVLELLRRFGVHMEAGTGGQIVIRSTQSIDLRMFLTYLMQIAGYNNAYFVPTI